MDRRINLWLAADMAVCTLWAVFAFHFCYMQNWFHWLPFLVAVLRLMTTVDLWRCRRFAIVPIAILSLLCVLDFIAAQTQWAEIGVSFLAVTDYTLQILNFEIQHWKMHDLFGTNHTELQTFVCYVFMIVWWIWAIGVPAVWYSKLAMKRQLRTAPVSWKRWTMLTLMLVFGRKFSLWRDPIWKRYFSFVLPFVAAYVIGDGMMSLPAKLFVALLPCLFYWMTNNVLRRKVCDKEFVFIAIGGILFYNAQFTYDYWRIFLLMASAVVVGYPCYRLMKETQQYALHLIVFFTCAILLPSITIGYNQYRVLEGERMAICSGCDDIKTGVFYVKDKDGHYGIRDRYGLVCPIEWNRLYPLNRYNTFFCASNETGCYIYEIRKKICKQICTEEARMVRVDDLTYKVVYIDSSHEVMKYVTLPKYSYSLDDIEIKDNL